MGARRTGVLAIIAVTACGEVPSAPADVSPDLLMAASHNPGHARDVQILDTCDTETFDAAIGAGTCLIDRGTTFDQFLHQLTQQQTVPSWRNNPQFTRETVGTVLDIRNDGGEVHTFTRVAQFGGGFVGLLNTLSGNPVPAPECLNVPSLGIVPSGGHEMQVLPSAGVNNYQCCIHPWMRTTIIGS